MSFIFNGHIGHTFIWIGLLILYSFMSIVRQTFDLVWFYGHCSLNTIIQPPPVLSPLNIGIASSESCPRTFKIHLSVYFAYEVMSTICKCIAISVVYYKRILQFTIDTTKINSFKSSRMLSTFVSKKPSNNRTSSPL